MQRNIYFLILLILGFQAFAQDVSEEKRNQKDSYLRFSGIPALGFDADNGFGTGLIGNMYLDKEGVSPYLFSIGAKIFVTTKGIHSHALTLDRIRNFGLPLRIQSRIGFYSTISQTYCGKGASANCDMDFAINAANKRDLQGSRRDAFLKHYYQHRYMSFFGDFNTRYTLWQSSIKKLELMTNYRGRYYLNGAIKERGFYKNSLYHEHFKNKVTEGFLSTLELGLMFDSRDNEAAPNSGIWMESSIRGGGSFIGSAWDFFGTNTAFRFYYPIDSNNKLILASQSVIDALFGFIPYDAMSRIGGSQAFYDGKAIGGQYIGRGITEQLYVGRFKVAQQLELRYNFFSFELFKQDFDVVAVGFGDFASTAWDYKNFLDEIKKIQAGFGGGLRIYWNKIFVIRADLGISPSENFAPRFYLTVGNVF